MQVTQPLATLSGDAGTLLADAGRHARCRISDAVRHMHDPGLTH